MPRRTDLHRILITHPVTTGNGVVGMLIEAVIGLDDRGGAAFGRDRMAAHRVDLRDHGHRQFGIDLGDRDGRT